jgi:hypothetical protein
MEIRQAEIAELPAIMQVYDAAKRFMRSTGNTTQWLNGYPREETVREDIESGNCFVLTSGDGIAGVFCMTQAEEADYRNITDGHWLNEEPYAVIHRLGSAGTERGVAKACIDWCFRRFPNLRADTNVSNLVMQHLLEQNGFVRCGSILVENRPGWIAYQKIS